MLSSTSYLVVEVKSKPTRPVISNNGPLCTSEQAVLSTQTLADQYVWSGVNGFTGSTAQVNVNNIDVTQGGLYELYVVNNGCKSDVANITLEVNQKPSLPVISNNAPLCSGEELIPYWYWYPGYLYLV